MTVSVARPINGISLNPLEYLQDENGDTVLFKDEETAKEWLKQMEFTEEQIESLLFPEEIVDDNSCIHA